MKTSVAVGLAVGGVIAGFFLGRAFPQGAVPSWLDADYIVSTPGTDGFCDARIVRQRMKGRAFVWIRRGACVPDGRFELRPKPGNSSPLLPTQPQGVHILGAATADGASEGSIYYYDLWQVLPNGTEKKLWDPEIEIGPPIL